MPMIRDDQRGATAIFVALVGLVLLGFAAIAIDVGAGFNERRGNQTAADVAVLGAAVDYIDPGMGFCGGAADGGCDAALDLVRVNIPTSYSNAEWLDLWRACVDPNKPPGFGPVPVDASWTSFSGTLWNGTIVNNAVDCISISPQEVRVRVPDQLLNTTFGNVLGFGTLTTNAVAQAAVSADGLAGLLPFGVLANASGHVCLLTASAGTAIPPCQGGASGNYYTIESQTWGPPSSDATTMDCANPGKPELIINTAIGIDHLIDTADAFAPANPNVYSFDPNPPGSPDDRATREDDCDPEDGVAVPSDVIPDTDKRDTLWVGEGNDDGAEVIKGLITGSPSDFASNAPNGGVGVVPRLRNVTSCFEADGSTPCAVRPVGETIAGSSVTYQVNNVPVWEYLRSVPLTPGLTCVIDGTNVPLPASADMVSDTDTMRCLLQQYGTGVPPGTILFDDDIRTNLRLAQVPQFHFNVWGPGRHRQPVKDYRVVYVHSLWLRDGGSYFELLPGDSDPSDPVCLGGGGPCRLILHQLSSFMLPDASLSSAVMDSFPSGPKPPYVVTLTQ